MSLKLIILACLLAVSHCRVTDVWRGSGPFLGSRIVGGHDAQPGQFPHQVSLQAGIPPREPFQHFCGGSILSERWILTAVHCLIQVEEQPEYMLLVKAGKHDLSKLEDSEQTSRVEAYYKHPKYEPKLNHGAGPYDIALIKLETPLRLTKHVATIPLPAKDSEPSGQVILSGWGVIDNSTIDPTYPTILQTFEVPIVDRKTCDKAVETIAWESQQVIKDVIHETNICTVTFVGGQSICDGDSGGPLIAKNQKGETEVVGVVSWGIVPCGRPGAPSVYVKVASFLDWIAEIRAEN